ncbi:uncharacterized protein DUF2746 [Propionicimonas paludicola]|uniref:Uncharacterized protein DUF2746 n=1 Tax=Propionicimonas paludicola TaxID=185243 RepID=A0A2A9CRU5_9ACTN|nr:DUF2746 domain-containing protein [Propionicimonas paludicola]PFG16269.1 uncharacterized protein DUF2746 [Propionicimonas paludicola]
MPAAPAGTPWWAWLIATVIVVGVPALVTWLTQRRTRQDVTAIKEQVANTHTTNLREDLDRLSTALTEGLTKLGADHLAAVESIREDIGGLHSETRDLRKDIAGVRTDARQDRRAVAALREEQADAMKRAVEQHVSDCPLRNPAA